MPGDADVVTSPFDATAIAAITTSFNTALDSIRFELVNTWYWVLDLEDLGAGALTVDAQLLLLDTWITDNIDSLDDNIPSSGPLAHVLPQWSTLSKMRNKFSSFEQWSTGLVSDITVRDRDLLTNTASINDTRLSVDDAAKFLKGDLIQINGEVMLVQQPLTHEIEVTRAVNRTTAKHHRAKSPIAIFDDESLTEFEHMRTRGLKPTDFDGNTMTLTFTPALEDGIYAFD